jgi:hypothetical protein
MKDIKELIYAAVEENAVKFQELVNAQLQVRAYDAIEALRPEVGASMFGEAKKMEDDEEEMEDEDEENEEMEDEDEMDDKKKSMKEALHPNQQKIDVVDDEKIDAKDLAKLRAMKKMKEEVEGLDELSTEKLLKYREAAKKDADVKNKEWDKKKLSDEGKYKLMNRETGTDQADQKIKRKTGSYRPGILARVGARLRNEEVEVDEAVNILMKDKDSTALRYPKGHSAHGDAHRAATAKAAKTARAAGSLKGSDRSTWKRPGQSVDSGGVSAARPAKPLGEEEAVADKVRTRGSVKFFSKKKLPGSDKSSMNEVAMPQNAADWQALITHQIKTTGHPVATDAQFRATHGKDETKIASQEPPKDKLNYAAAQGGTVKR